MYKAVLFDMDGVIIDSEPVRQAQEKELFKKLGMNVTDEEHQSYVGTTSEGMWQGIKSNHDTPHSVKELVEMEQSNYLSHLEEYNDQYPMPGVVDLIKNLHENSMTLVVASSACMKNIEVVVKKFELEKYFTKLVSGEEVPKGKPAPDVFLEAAKQINMTPEQCVVIEDAMNGIAAAKAAEMKCIGISSPHRTPQDLSKADLVVDHLSKVDYNILQNL
ncbi:HAD family hydrolase [Patescibacteria group bacterium]